MIADPINAKLVRLTNNDIKECDSYPDNQSRKFLFSGPDGKPYDYLEEGGSR